MRASMIPPQLEYGRSGGLLSALDVQFATRLGALYSEAAPEVLWGVALACRQEAHGHVCADLPRLAIEGLRAEGTAGTAGASGQWTEAETRTLPALPEGVEIETWMRALRASPLVGPAWSAGSEPQPTPLVLDDRGRLYLRRSFDDQIALAAAIRRRATRADCTIDRRLASSAIDRLSRFASASDDEATEGMRRALWTGLTRPLSVVTGGPGTGKTTLVARLIALALEERLGREAGLPRIRLLAPTGKAAAAMTASFQRQRDALDVPPEVRAALPTNAETIQRALLRLSRRDAFGLRHGGSLDADIVVVDEASMVDLALMRELFAACEGADRIVLLGDPDQLASIDSGAVLAELCAGGPAEAGMAGRGERGLRDSIVSLRTSHRFASGGAIGLLAEAIRAGDADRALALLADPAHPEIERFEVDSIPNVRARLIESVLEIQRQIETADSPGAKLDRLSSRRILCAHRRGPLGVERLCEVLDEAAAQARKTTSRSGWWRGRLLLVTRNAPDQDLWNGDVGLVEDTQQGLRALFADAKGGVRALSAGRLPPYESGIAMSVHKSQGSEFDGVDLVLGATASGLMTRELLYTGVTRARKRLRLHASAEAIRAAITRRVTRDSGLAELLWEAES